MTIEVPDIAGKFFVGFVSADGQVHHLVTGELEADVDVTGQQFYEQSMRPALRALQHVRSQKRA